MQSIAPFQQNNQLVILIRHGERADNAGFVESNLIQNQNDPHLTVIGKDQSIQTGQFVEQYIKKEFPQIKKLKIISSPFLRCVMTADNFIRGCNDLEIEENQIDINIGISEQLKSTWFEDNVVTSKLLTVYDADSLKQYVNSKISFKQDTENTVTPQFPEDSFDQLIQRTKRGYNAILQEQLQENKNNNNDTCLILFTHGVSVNVLVTDIVNKIKLQNKDTQPLKSKFSLWSNTQHYVEIEYCAVSLISHNVSDGSLQIPLKFYSEHILKLKLEAIKQKYEAVGIKQSVPPEPKL